MSLWHTSWYLLAFSCPSLCMYTVYVINWKTEEKLVLLTLFYVCGDTMQLIVLILIPFMFVKVSPDYPTAE